MAEPLNATFFAFRKREKTGVLLSASALYIIMASLLMAGFVAINLSTLGPLASWYVQLIGNLAQAGASGGMPSFPTPPSGIGLFVASIIPFLFLVYVLLASYEAACLRWMIRSETGGLLGLTLGADTWRVYATYWMWFILYIGFSIVVGIASAAITVGVVMASHQNLAATMIATVAVSFARLALTIYFCVRLAPAAAASIGRRKFSFFSAWNVTRGRFWALFGAFFLIILIFIVLEIVVFGVVLGVALGPALPTLSQLGPNPDSAQVMGVLASLLTPQNMIAIAAGYAVLLLAGLFIYVLFYGVNARAVLAAAEEGKIDGVTSAAAEAFT
jgi:hypothetical protein